tara:strand:- start:6001 stop:7881 length:1881 start_codon:yes stop_codon:yes gene_type:complete
MAAPSNLRLTGLDFDELRSNFKNYLETQEEFTDYDSTGSAFSVLLDVLSYNTHINSFYLNMIANEMFIDTAIKRNSLMSLSKMLGYLPKSRKSSYANVTISVTPTDNPSNITIAKNTRFKSEINGITFTFVTDRSYSAVANGNSTVTLSNIKLVQGEPLTFRYTANTSDHSIKYKIPNRGIDTDSITVNLQESEENTTQSSYTLATDLLNVNSSANVFFIEPDADDTYQIRFGDGILGRKEKTGNIVIIGYNLTNGVLGNGARIFSPVSTVAGYPGATVTTISASVGGSDEESNDNIRFNAPRHYEVQNRAVTANDYKRIITREYPQAESVVVYGGENADPPEFGKVFIGIKPKSGLAITTSVKDFISEVLTKYNVGSITPDFVDIDYIFPILTLTVNYDSRFTSKTTSVLQRDVLNSITSYSTNELQEFSKDLRISKLTRTIDDTNTSIVGNELSIKLKKSFNPTLSEKLNYTIRFSNRIHHPHAGHMGAVTSTEFTILDGENISRSGCKFDDVDGIIRVFRIVDGNKKIVYENQGTIDYEKGEIILNLFNPSAYIGSSLDIIAKPENQDVRPLREQVVLISESNINITMNDVSSVRTGLITETQTSTTTTTSATSTSTSSSSTY